MIVNKKEYAEGVIYLGDCLEILPTLGDGVAEICVTSPPYNLSKDKTTHSTTKVSANAVRQFENWYFDEMPELEYQEQQKTLISSLMKCCKSSIFYNHKIRYAWHSRNKHKTPTRIYHPLDWLREFPIWCEVIWDRCGIGRPSRRFHVSDERVYQIGRPVKWSNPTGLNNIWRIPPSRNNGHVCSFPARLVENCMLTTTDQNDIVIDPYLGSGTTAIVAIKHKRRFIGIEKDPKYFKLACENVESALQNPTLF